MFIKHLRVSGLLSFGPKGINLPMRKLNVLIGANGSGKSNLLEVINLLHEAPSQRHSIAGPIMSDGGVGDWLWKGDWKLDDAPPPAHVSCVIEGPSDTGDLKHEFSFYSNNHLVYLDEERIELAERPADRHSKPWWFYRMNVMSATLRDGEVEVPEETERKFKREELSASASILAQIRDPKRYVVFAHLQDCYSTIQLYRNWCFGPRAALRKPPKATDRTDELIDSGLNLAMVVAAMPITVKARAAFALRTLYPEIKSLQVRPVGGGSLQLYIEEQGNIEIPASRLSDGTLRYLALLVILLNPEPPPLVVIEEPELGLHPDVIPKLAELLIEASENMQIIITTHSRMLVDALGDDPESVIVCEKHDGESTFERLDGERMKVWLEKYSLGALWSKGEIGGNRW